MLVGLIWKWSFFQFADQVYQTIAIRDEFFPAFLQDATVLRWAYLATIASLIVAIAVPFSLNRFGPYWLRLIASASCWLGASILICHQGSYNDMTFVTVWWCAAFVLWYSSRINVEVSQELIQKAAVLSRIMVSLVFLGGAVGKWTSEYWSGQVLYEIYFVERDFWFFAWARDCFKDDALREVATYYSRLVIVVESLGGFLWTFVYFMKSWKIAAIAMIAFAMIGLLSNYLLFSVLAPMIGLAMVGCFDSVENTKRACPDDPIPSSK